jgi:hypothetical protein
MIARDLGCKTTADEITTGIADVSHNDAIIAKSAGDHSGGHARTSGARRSTQFVNAGVRSLDEPRHQDGVGFASRRCTKAVDQRFDRRSRCHFAALFASHPIGQREKPAMRASVVSGGGQNMPGIVFVMIANTACIGQFGELEIEH